MQKLTEEQIERVVANVAANLRFEGMECTEEDKAAIQRIASGQTTAAEECAAVIAKYKKLAEDAADLAVYEEAHAEYISSGMKSSPIDGLWKELDLDEDADAKLQEAEGEAELTDLRYSSKDVMKAAMALPKLVYDDWKTPEADGWPPDWEWCMVMWLDHNNQPEVFVGSYNEDKKAFYANFGLGGAVLDLEDVVAWMPLHDRRWEGLNEDSADLFYSESNIRHLENIMDDIEDGNAHFAEHDLPDD